MLDMYQFSLSPSVLRSVRFCGLPMPPIGLIAAVHNILTGDAGRTGREAGKTDERQGKTGERREE